MAALAQALDDGFSLSDIRLLSLGTGMVPRFIEGERLDWGFLQWAPRLLPIILEGLMGVPDYQCRAILGDTGYFRLAPVWEEIIDADEAQKADRLAELAASADISAVVEWLGAYW